MDFCVDWRSFHLLCQMVGLLYESPAHIRQECAPNWAKTKHCFTCQVLHIPLNKWNGVSTTWEEVTKEKNGYTFNLLTLSGTTSWCAHNWYGGRSTGWSLSSERQRLIKWISENTLYISLRDIVQVGRRVPCENQRALLYSVWGRSWMINGERCWHVQHDL